MSLVFTPDITGFPLVHLLDTGYAVHLWPITRTQFEMAWPQHPAQQAPDEAAPVANPEALLMTGIVPADITAFAAWMNSIKNAAPGTRFQAPSVEQWRHIHDYLQFERLENHLDAIKQTCTSPAAQHLLQTVLQERAVHTLLELSLMREGIVEWVWHEDQWTGLGQPSWDFYPNTFEPMNETIEPIETTRPQQIFGLRLIRVLC